MPRGMQGARSKVVTSSDSTERKSAGAPQWVHPHCLDQYCSLPFGHMRGRCFVLPDGRRHRLEDADLRAPAHETGAVEREAIALLGGGPG